MHKFKESQFTWPVFIFVPAAAKTLPGASVFSILRFCALENNKIFFKFLIVDINPTPTKESFNCYLIYIFSIFKRFLSNKLRK